MAAAAISTAIPAGGAIPPPKTPAQVASASGGDSVGAVCAGLRELQLQRVLTLRQQLRIENGTGAFARTLLGWHWQETDRDEVKLAASVLLDAIAENAPTDPRFDAQVPAIREQLAADTLAAKPYLEHRTHLEKRMRQLAESLPVYPWVEKVKGFGALGLAIIVGEAGDLSRYGNPGKLWKRLGLAPHNGKAASTWRKAGGLSAEEWTVLGYSPRRRSAIWTLADSLLKHPSPYQDLYRQRREYECQQRPEFLTGKANEKTGRPQVTKHCDNRARRYAEKRLIRDLWRAWRDVR